MSENALDFDEFMNRVQDDKELLFELLDIFIQDFQIKQQELKEAVEKDDSETIKHVAHFLRGSCGNISAKVLRAIFTELEKKGAKGQMEGLEQDLKDIDQRFEELIMYIGELRARL
ncbi:MAG: Hpt domain-containing protein [Candidatus Omnitrophica bacterium]|nr:Hpt domain-containing protein [Candidatus Omnitrophota bacterium]